MLTAVTGSSGIEITGPSATDRVVGISTADPTALLRAAENETSGHVILLCPGSSDASARRQAHVLISAAPRIRVAVMALEHHPLTLTLIAAAAARQAGPGTDPGDLVALIQRSAARSRSLVWYPRALGVPEVQPSIGQLLGSVFGAPGYFRELGTDAGLLPAKVGSPVESASGVYVAGDVPALLDRQLRTTVRTVPVQLERQPWSTGSAVPISVLIGVDATPGGLPCPLCGAAQVVGGCPFCGTRAARADAVGAAAGPSAGEARP